MYWDNIIINFIVGNLEDMEEKENEFLDGV